MKDMCAHNVANGDRHNADDVRVVAGHVRISRELYDELTRPSKPPIPMRLWHFTCEHGYRQIGTHGTLKPNRHVLLGDAPPVVWLTDLQSPERDAVGLTSRFITCDRMAYRYMVNEGTVERWADFADEHDVPLWVRADLESYGDPEHWFVSTRPLRARLA